jgi:hypothetical protein
MIREVMGSLTCKLGGDGWRGGFTATPIGSSNFHVTNQISLGKIASALRCALFNHACYVPDDMI